MTVGSRVLLRSRWRLESPMMFAGTAGRPVYPNPRGWAGSGRHHSRSSPRNTPVRKWDNIDMTVPSHYSAAPSGDLCTTSRAIFVVRGESRRSVPITGERPQPFRRGFPAILHALVASPPVTESSPPALGFTPWNAEQPSSIANSEAANSEAANSEALQTEALQSGAMPLAVQALLRCKPARAAAGTGREQMKHEQANTGREQLQQEVGARHAPARRQSMRSSLAKSQLAELQLAESPMQAKSTGLQLVHGRRGSFPRNSFFT